MSLAHLSFADLLSLVNLRDDDIDIQILYDSTKADMEERELWIGALNTQIQQMAKDLEKAKAEIRNYKDQSAQRNMSSTPNKRMRKEDNDQSASSNELKELRVILDIVRNERDHFQTEYAKNHVKCVEGKQLLEEQKAEIARLKEAEAQNINTKKRLEARMVHERDISKQALHRLKQIYKQQLDLKDLQIDKQKAEIARLEKKLRARDNLWGAFDKLTDAHFLLESYSTDPTLISQERINSLVQDAYGLLNDHLQKYTPS
tara:strand:- start:245 stop:1024 length:780 start_codon:yes stop_codon:yes gene_type:complete